MLGIKIKNALKVQGITQKKLSDMTGIPQSSIVDIIKSRVDPSVDKIKKIAAALTLDLNWLISDTYYNDNIQGQIWRVSDGAGENTLHAAAFEKRVRILYLHIIDDSDLPAPKEVAATMDFVELLLKKAKLNNFPEDMFWLLTGHTRDQFLKETLDNELYNMVRKIKELPEEKLKLVDALINNIK